MADIVTVPSGTFTPGALAALQNAANIINAAWNVGLDKSTELTGKIGAITDETTGWLSTQSAPHVTAGSVDSPTIVEPSVDIPTTQSTTDVYTDFESEYTKLVLLLANRFSSFRTDYFPDDSPAYAAAEDWLQAAIANNSGLPAAVSAQILTDDKDRILKEADRASESVLATFAARRYPLPPGAAAAAISDITVKAQDEIATSGRKIVVGSIEQLRWVVEKTISLRQLAMGSAIDYIKALASGPDMASRLVSVGYDAQSKLISAASQFYNSRTAAAELTAKVGQFNESLALQAGEKNQAADMSMIENRLKALLTECQTLAQLVTSLFNNVHASASTSYSVNVT